MEDTKNEVEINYDSDDPEKIASIKDPNLPHHIDDDGDLDSYEGTLKMTKFIMKNGCCRDCMKAFSKTGKVIIFAFFIPILVLSLSSPSPPTSSYPPPSWLQVLWV